MRRSGILRLVTTLFVGGPLLGLAPAADAGSLRAWGEDPLVKVFRDAAAPADRSEAVADVARGEYATFQIVARSPEPLSHLRCTVGRLAKDDGAMLEGAAVRFVGYVPVDRPLKTPPKDRVRKPPADFPDPLLERPEVDVKGGDAQPIWVTLKVPLDSAPGTYRGQATVSGVGGGEAESVVVPLTINVYPAKVERTRLWVTNWFQRDRGFAPMPAYYTPEFWQLLRAYARDMAAHRQTVARTVPLELAEYSFDDQGRMSIDWSHMDQWVQTFIDEGVIGRIEGQQFGWRGEKWESPFVVSTYAPKVGRATEVRVDPTSPEAERFYSQFLPALQRHVVEKGWIDIWMQHVADEPVPANIASYRQIAGLVKKYAPRLRRIEAILTKEAIGSVEVLVPLSSDLHHDYDTYKARQAAGDELWFYTCVNPQGEYANRFHENPLIKVRLIPWTAYRFGVTGYLHWGYNFWNNLPDNERVRTLAYGTGRSDVVPGDAWVVYPKLDGLGVIDSLRWEAQRDGCNDHELLSQLGERDPEAAMAIARRHVEAFDRYETDLRTFRKTRRELLERLSH